MHLLLTEFTEKQLRQTIDSAKKSMGHRNLARIQACERELERRKEMEVVGG